MALKEEITQPNSKLHAVKCGENPWVKIFFFFFSNNACCKWKKKVLYVNSQSRSSRSSGKSAKSTLAYKTIFGKFKK
jgi:hypothetical protein